MKGLSSSTQTFKSPSASCLHCFVNVNINKMSVNKSLIPAARVFQLTHLSLMEMICHLIEMKMLFKGISVLRDITGLWKKTTHCHGKKLLLFLKLQVILLCGEEDGLPCPFMKSEECPNFRNKCSDRVHLWVIFLIKNVLLRVPR